MKKKCLSCGRSFILSGSGKPQKYCSECARRGTVRGRGLPASKSLKTRPQNRPPGWRVNLKDLRRSGKERCGFGEPRKATPDIIRIEGNLHVPLTRLEPDPPARAPQCVQVDIWPRPWGATRSGFTSRLKRSCKSWAAVGGTSSLSWTAARSTSTTTAERQQ